MISPLSRLTLGTAQFGGSYGVANRTGVPDFPEICAMLEVAAAGGVNALDTAFAYGNSEEILGRALDETRLRGHFLVATKTNSLLPGDLPAGEAHRLIRESVEQSLRRLRAEFLPVVLLHRDSNPAYLDALATCREAGLIGRCGVSFGSPSNAEKFRDHPSLEAMQSPFNVLDTRFESIARTLKERNGLVFSRSCYLQGLLLMGDSSTPSHLRPVKQARDYFLDLAETHGLGPSELFLRAMLGRPEIDSVVVGMENLAQLRENIRIFNKSPLSPTLLAAISGYTPDLPDWLVDPPQWNSHAVEETEA